MIVLFTFERTVAAANVVVWDTGARAAETTAIDKRSDWKRVPSELFSFEADPPKAASDPGYYGREYSFAGDALVENRNLAALFRSPDGKVAIYAKDFGAVGASGTGDSKTGRKIMEIVPLQTESQPVRIGQVRILRNTGDEAAIEVSFATKSAPASAVFILDKTEVIEIRPADGIKGIRLLGSISYGVAPAFIGDDLIYGAADYPSANKVSVPADHLFVGLLEGGNTELVTTWPQSKQIVSLGLGTGSQGNRSIESIDLDNSGQSIYVGVLNAPGIWHRETLTPAFLEKEVRIDWKRPFPARWKTQLLEADVKTTFAFRDSRGEIWRGVPGSYDYPVWFDGDATFFHLGKKVPPKGEALIYSLEGQDTPPGITTPVDIMKATLGRPVSDPILDVTGRNLRTHHRRGGDGVHRACTCGCTEAIQAVFEKGDEVTRKDYINGALGDMNYFVQCHVERIDEYMRFADETIKFLEAQQSSNPELKPYLENLEQIVQQIPQEYNVQKENMKSASYADELTRQTLALTDKKDPKNLSAYMDLLKAWRGMGGSQDYVVAQCHMITRKLAQEAGYGCADQPKAVDLAMEIRSRCRKILRNPDGYEIWANY
ncbi:MAG TPA: hypothetical protein VLU94_02255 [Candidatus Nitrosotalea sp.]|nr:hypothetical protein [Candidatus Nitrosotalea sp.]